MSRRLHTWMFLAAVAAGALLCPSFVSAEAVTSIGDGKLLKVESRMIQPFRYRPVSGANYYNESGLWFEIWDQGEGELEAEGWVPGTDDGALHLSPTLGYDVLTRQAILVWSRGSGETSELRMAKLRAGEWSEPVFLTRNSVADLYPVLAVDSNARIHMVWWRPHFNGMVMYGAFHALASGFQGDPKPLSLGLNWTEGPVLFPYIAYQETTRTLYMAVNQAGTNIHLYRFAVDGGGELPTGGGEIIMPVAMYGPEWDFGEGEEDLEDLQNLQTLLTFAGPQEIPVLYWVLNDTLYFYYLEDNERASRVFSMDVDEDRYDASGLESLVSGLVLDLIKGRTGNSIGESSQSGGYFDGYR